MPPGAVNARGARRDGPPPPRRTLDATSCIGDDIAARIALRSTWTPRASVSDALQGRVRPPEQPRRLVERQRGVAGELVLPQAVDDGLVVHLRVVRPVFLVVIDPLEAGLEPRLVHPRRYRAYGVVFGRADLGIDGIRFSIAAGAPFVIVRLR